MISDAHQDLALKSRDYPDYLRRLREYQQALPEGTEVRVLLEDEYERAKTHRELEDGDVSDANHEAQMDLLLQNLAHDQSELNGFLLGRNGQGGILRDLRDDISRIEEENRKRHDELRGEIAVMSTAHKEEIVRVNQRVDGLKKDVDAEHKARRELEITVERRTKNWGTFWGSTLKVLLTVLAGSAMVVASWAIGNFLN